MHLWVVWCRGLPNWFNAFSCGCRVVQVLPVVQVNFKNSLLLIALLKTRYCRDDFDLFSRPLHLSLGHFCLNDCSVKYAWFTCLRVNGISATVASETYLYSLLDILLTYFTETISLVDFNPVFATYEVFVFLLKMKFFVASLETAIW